MKGAYIAIIRPTRNEKIDIDPVIKDPVLKFIKQ